MNGLIPSDLRSSFPHADTLSYLATCSIAPASAMLSSALAQLVDDLHSADAWARFDEIADRLRRQFATLVGAHPDQIALLPDVSTAAYQAASVQRWRGRRRRVLLAGSDWPGITHVWLAQQVRGCEVITVDTPDSPRTLDNFLSVLDERTTIVSAPLVAWRDGLRLPLDQLAAAAHRVGARVFVDASHAAGVLPVDVERLGCDYLVTTTSTYLLGLPGLALLYVRQPAGGPKPTLTGPAGRRDPHSLEPFTLDWSATARRFETGTPAVGAAYAALAGLEAISSLRPDHLEAHVRALAHGAAQQLASHGVHLAVTDPDQRGAHLAIVEPHATALSRFLQAHDVITAPQAGLVRAAFHAFSTRQDVDRLCEAVIAYQTHPRVPQPIPQPR